MPRIARLEVIGYPYHVIQRGNRNQKVFIREGDKAKYLKILRVQAELFGVDIWAYCLMDNHVHLIVMPKHEGALTECISETHRSYTLMVNYREEWRGHLWQGRFKSYPMDEKHLWAAVRYVERNPVRAGMVNEAGDYLWSSARTHLGLDKIKLLSHFYLLDQIKSWKEYLAKPEDDKIIDILRMHGKTGRPLGEKVFIDGLEAKTGMVLTKQKPGPRIKVTVGVPKLF